MLNFTWPSELENKEALIAPLGSFWTNIFKDKDLVKSLLYARAQLDLQAHNNFLELVSSLSINKVPIFHTKNYYLLTLEEDDLLNNSPYFSWLLPTGLINVNVILDSITNNNLTLINGIDFFIEDNVINFLKNPIISDSKVNLWLYKSEWDLDILYNQFGYVTGFKYKSTSTYKDFLNAYYNCLTTGSTELNLRYLLASLYDVPVSKEEEIIEEITQDNRNKWIITDKNTYKVNTNSTVIVNINNTLQPGDFLNDAIKIFTITRGTLPDEIESLVLKKGILSTGYSQSLTFSNEEVLLNIDTSSEYTKVSFLIDGLTVDINKFWNDIHTKGVSDNNTLAMLLDQRPLDKRDTQPNEVALPKSINPLEFLVSNIFRNNLIIIKLKSTSFGSDALPLDRDLILRKLIPPQNYCLIIE